MDAPQQQSPTVGDDLVSEVTPFTIASSSAAGGGLEGSLNVNARPRLLEEFTRSYFAASRRAYTLAAFVVPQIKVGWIVFSTAMYYYHAFVERHDTTTYDPVLVITGAIFLASKVEHFRVKLANIVALALDAPEGSPEHEARKSQVVTMELMLVHTLDFNFLVLHPLATMHQIAPQSTEVGKIINKLYSYMCVSPLQLRVKHTEIAQALVWIVAEGLGVLDRYRPQLVGLSEVLKDQIYDVVLEVLHMMGKKSTVSSIDAAVSAMARARRSHINGTPTPTPRADQTPFVTGLTY